MPLGACPNAVILYGQRPTMKGVRDRARNSSTAVNRFDYNQRRMKGSLLRFIELPLPDQAATAEALAVVAVARLRLSLLSQPQIANWLQPRITGALFDEMRKSIGARGSAERVAAAVRRASQRVPGASCLVQALAGSWMLERRGIASRIRIGVDKESGRFSAHAWLTVDDVIVLGGAESAFRFVELQRH